MTDIAQRQSLPPTSVGASTIFSALHESRRREAINVIHRYRHIVSDLVQINLCDPPPLPDAKTRARQILNKRRDKQVRRMSETHLIILVLLGFGIVHVIGGVLLQRASPPQGNSPLVVAGWSD